MAPRDVSASCDSLPSVTMSSSTKWTDQDFLVLLADMNQQDLAALGDLMSAGKVRPIVDRTYSLAETPEAIRYLEQGRARGKVIIQVEDAALLAIEPDAHVLDGG